jgi:phosphogluconate dehydratase
MHLVAMARAGGILLTWQDIAELSELIPLLARVYPNGLADVNHFQAAGGMGFLIKELLKQGLVHDDVRTVFGHGLQAYTVDAQLGENGGVMRQASPEKSHDPKVLASIETPFQANGGLKMLRGNLGKAVIKISAVKAERHIIEAPAIIFHSQQELQDAFKEGKLNRDFVAVVRFQGPKANGMPELHKLTPPLGVLQDRGFRVALLTDGRMSGASGKVPAAIHVTPEAVDGGPIARIRDGDIIRLDAIRGTLEVLVDAADMAEREPIMIDLSDNEFGMGRELFAPFRHAVGPSDQGASVLFQTHH